MPTRDGYEIRSSYSSGMGNTTRCVMCSEMVQDTPRGRGDHRKRCAMGPPFTDHPTIYDTPGGTKMPRKKQNGGGTAVAEKPAKAPKAEDTAEVREAKAQIHKIGKRIADYKFRLKTAEGEKATEMQTKHDELVAQRDALRKGLES